MRRIAGKEQPSCGYSSALVIIIRAAQRRRRSPAVATVKKSLPTLKVWRVNARENQ